MNNSQIFWKNCKDNWFICLFFMLIIIFLSWGTAHFIGVLNVLEKSTVASCHSTTNHIATLQVLQSKVFSSEVITFLITLTTALLITLGIFCLNRINKAHEKNNAIIDNFKKEHERLQKQDNIHIPILSIYSSVKSLHMFFYGKETLDNKDTEYLNSFCYYTERHIGSIKDMLSKISMFDEKYQYFLVNTYMDELIDHLEEIVDKVGKQDSYSGMILSELEELRTRIYKIHSEEK